MIFGKVCSVILIVSTLVICITNGIAWSKANVTDSFIKVWLLTYNLIQVVVILIGIAQLIL